MRRLIATLAGLLALGAGTVAVATSGAAEGPSATTAINRADRVGSYRGTTEEGGTVRFTITKKRKVVGFTMPKVPYDCVVQDGGNGGTHYSGPPVTIKGPPMKLKGVAKFAFQDLGDDTRADQGFFIDGKPDTSQGGVNPPQGRLNGNAGAFSWDGPAYQAGTEYCATEYVDWSAHKVGRKK